MPVKIGPTIGIDGEKEYRKEVNQLISQQKTFTAEMRKLESEFDKNTSAMEKSRKKSELLNKQIKSQKELVKELEKGLEEARKKYSENSTQVQQWERAVANAKTELNKMNAELKNLPNGMQAAGKAMQDAGGKMKTVGSTLTKYVTAPLTGLAAASVAAWNEVDEGLDIVTKKTGATGEALEELQQSAINIAETIPTSFETAGEAVGEVNTRFGLTGEELEKLSTKFIKFADLNDTDVSSSIDKVQKLMAAYGVSTEDAGAVLDVLNKTGQDTGISMETLEEAMLRNAASMKSMGLDAYDAAIFLGQVETSGADTSVVMAGLQKALSNAAKAGKSLPEALKDFQKTMKSSKSDQEKLTAAVSLFGAKTGPAIYEACKSGSLSFESLSTDASAYMGNVETTFENVKDPADNFTVALNKAKSAGSILGDTLQEMAAPAVETLGNMAKSAGEWLQTLS
ncbi:MAG: phage tail tape measure protein, partial [Lachnospiraceae bacterium]|nr:phage tail tape measure protein [Lachnospiraceae bacterium]